MEFGSILWVMTYQRTVGEARSGFTFRHSDGRGLPPPIYGTL